MALWMTGCRKVLVEISEKRKRRKEQRKYDMIRGVWVVEQ